MQVVGASLLPCCTVANWRKLQARITTLEGDLAVAQERLRSGWSPAAAEFAALEAKLEAVAKEQVGD